MNRLLQGAALVGMAGLAACEEKPGATLDSDAPEIVCAAPTVPRVVTDAINQCDGPSVEFPCGDALTKEVLHCLDGLTASEVEEGLSGVDGGADVFDDKGKKLARVFLGRCMLEVTADGRSFVAPLTAVRGNLARCLGDDTIITSVTLAGVEEATTELLNNCVDEFSRNSSQTERASFICDESQD